jgi:hypothetical protein
MNNLIKRIRIVSLMIVICPFAVINAQGKHYSKGFKQDIKDYWDEMGKLLEKEMRMD